MIYVQATQKKTVDWLTVEISRREMGWYFFQMRMELLHGALAPTVVFGGE